MSDIDPHAGEGIESAGVPPQATDRVLVLLHGRGDSPAGILRLVDDIYERGVRYLAPAAAGRVWYPGELTDPVTDRRQAYLDSAFGQVERALDEAEAIGVAPGDVVLAGFSQGASVATEFATRRPRRYGGLVALAGGLLGPTDELEARDGSLDGTPAVCGVGSEDPHISVEHAETTAAALSEMGADASAETYPGVGHAIGDGAVETLRRLTRRD